MLRFLPENTIGTTELSKIVNKHHLTVKRWAVTGKLPRPKYIVGRVLLWDKLEVFEALRALGYDVPAACNDGEYQK